MDRLDEIRERLESAEGMFAGRYILQEIYADHVRCLLESADELERENERLREACNRMLNVHEFRNGYVDAVMFMAEVMEQAGARDKSIQPSP